MNSDREMITRDYTTSTLFENPLKQSLKISTGLHQEHTVF